MMDKSFSDSNLNVTATDSNKTPPNFISQRIKRKRDDDFFEEMDKFREEIKLMIHSMLAPQNTELSKISPTLIEIQQINKNIENSITFLTSQNKELQGKIEQYEIQAKRDREHITLLEDKIEELQRLDRKNNLEIKNVPKAKNETKDGLVNMVLSLSKNVGCELSKSDIKDIYRIKSKKEGPNNMPIIVETGSTLLKNDLLKSCKSFNVKHRGKLCAKNMGFTVNEDTPIFILEQLTAKGSRLFFLARDLVKTKSYKFCWTSFGRVFVRKNEQTPIILIKSESQVHHLLQVA
ncbi:unnamed protein product [Diatraea saccharalis]|uniref:FP protein C-terminal domain-containing protein n=1 Tax=Diatraea saccharalis TaxID=40085 RepID=A0A9N9R1N6_9NEOP|nr:unnamed protein product [Diatraea saccharalis]